ncbi:MAG: hypothetical protein KW793_03845 [Candidatus Doudnabacteria bacterium]|nr:hypothetical protein [Candidatus Doudnabacteria bacterium]
MANRVIRDWTTSAKVDLLSPEAELFLVRLIMKADDHGCFHAHPKLLKAALFPLRELSDDEVLKWLWDCVNANIIHVYDVEGRRYLKIVDFGQRLRNMRSQFPQPADNPPTIVRESPPETKRNEVETESETNTNCVDFDELFLKAFDERACESYKLSFREIDLGAELQRFKTKCDNNPAKYHSYDVGGLRSAFQYQLSNIRSNGKRKPGTLKDGFDSIDELLAKERDTSGANG